MTTAITMRNDTKKAQRQLKRPRSNEDNTNPRQASGTVKQVANDTQERIKISDLMEKNGVTAEDFQAVYEKNPEIINDLGGGETCKKLARSADKVVTKYKGGLPLTGKCLPGVREIYNRERVDSLACDEARKALLESRKPFQKTNGGGNGYVALEASGDYIIIKIENKAYNKPKNGTENKEMNDMIKKVKPGITVTLDPIDDSTLRAKNGNGGKYGHIAVKRNDGYWGCDFKQQTINFSRYGEYWRICTPKDAEISSKYAQMLIETANERQQKQEQKKDKVQQQFFATKTQTR